MFKVKTLNNISKAALSRLPAARYDVGDGVTAPHAFLVRSADMHAMAFEDGLLAVGRAGAGTNNIPVAELSKRGVVVFNAPGANANAVKELVLSGMLMAVRNLREAMQFVDSVDPARADLDEHVEAAKKRFVGSELEGRTLGVVGLGAIGVKVANAARALGMRVLGFDPHMTVEGAWRLSSDVVKAGSLNELYAESDFLSLHVPLNDKTRGLYGEAAIAASKRGIVVLNFARDAIVDEAAMVQGLTEGQVGRYVSDFPSAALIKHPRMIALPHLGASTLEAEENCGFMVVDQLRDFLENGNLSNSVNFPNVRMSREARARICIANRNVPGIIGSLSQVCGSQSVNIAQMQNASRGEYAYTILDVDATVGPELTEAIAAIEGILSVRVI